jgi:hypothetical protein
MNPKRAIAAVSALATGIITSRRRCANIAAFHQGRSGSRLLGDLLKQHPQIVWEGELFSPGRLGDIASRWPLLTRIPLRILRLRMLMAGKACYGFETQPTQVEHLEISLEEYVSQLESLGFRHFIMLERLNHLRRFVSMLVARTNSQWHLQQGTKPELVRIRLDTENLLMSRGRDTQRRSLVAHLDREIATWRVVRQILERRNLLYLTYEQDLASRPEAGYGRVCEFLGLPAHPVSVRFHQTNPHRLDQILENYDEVAAALAGTPYAWMLHA